MIDFHSKVVKGSKGEKMRKYDRKHLLASIALEESGTSEKPNYCLYCAATHLAEIPELCVNALEFERLASYPLDTKFDTEVYVYLRDKLKELDDLRNTLLFTVEV